MAIAEQLSDQALLAVHSGWENDYISGVAFFTILVYGDDTRILEIVNSPDLKAEQQANFCYALFELYGRELALMLPPAEQLAINCYGLCSSVGHYYTLSRWIAGWTFTDATVGGATIGFRKTLRCRVDFTANHRTFCKLTSARGIRAAVRQVMRRKDIEAALVERETLSMLPWANDGAVIAILAHSVQAAIDTIRDRLALSVLRQNRMLVEKLLKANCALTKKNTKTLIRYRKKPVVRAVKLATNVFGASTVRKFVNGDPIDIIGHSFTYRLRLIGSVYDVGHGPVKIMILAHDGRHLCNLCSFFTDTPAIDQLVATMFHVQEDESERTFINTGNVYQATEEGVRHPIILARLNRRDRRAKVPKAFDRSLHNIAEERYISMTWRLYMGRVILAVWGRDSKRYRSLLKEMLKGSTEYRDRLEQVPDRAS